jgi:hypothetical protein
MLFSIGFNSFHAGDVCRHKCGMAQAFACMTESWAEVDFPGIA